MTRTAVLASILLVSGAITGVNAQPSRLLDEIYGRQFQPMHGVHSGDLEIEKAQARSATTSETLVLPMIWNGVSSTQSSGVVVLLSNTGSAEATVKIEFSDASGARAEIPMLSPEGNFRALDGTVAPQSVIGFITNAENQREQKLQARITASPAGAVTIAGFLMVQRESMSVLGIPVMAPRFKTFSTVAMVSSTFNGNVIVSNGGTTASTVTLAARSEGQTLCRATFTIPALGARDLSYRDSLSCMRSFEGPVVLTAETTGTANLAFAGYTEVNQTIGSVVPTVR